MSDDRARSIEEEIQAINGGNPRVDPEIVTNPPEDKKALLRRLMNRRILDDDICEQIGDVDSFFAPESTSQEGRTLCLICKEEYKLRSHCKVHARTLRLERKNGKPDLSCIQYKNYKDICRIFADKKKNSVLDFEKLRAPSYKVDCRNMAVIMSELQKANMRVINYDKDLFDERFRGESAPQRIQPATVNLVLKGDLHSVIQEDGGELIVTTMSNPPSQYLLQAPHVQPATSLPNHYQAASPSPHSPTTSSQPSEDFETRSHYSLASIDPVLDDPPLASAAIASTNDDSSSQELDELSLPSSESEKKKKNFFQKFLGLRKSVKTSENERSEWWDKQIAINEWAPPNAVDNYDLDFDGLAGVGNTVNMVLNDCEDKDEIFTGDDYVHEKDVKRISSLLMKRTTLSEEELAKQMEGFNLVNIEASHKKMSTILKRRLGPKIENFPWVYVAQTRECGLGMFANCRIPKDNIVCLNTGRMIQEKKSLDYADEIYKKRPECNFFLTVKEYEMGFDTGQGRIVLEGHRRTHRGVVVLGRYVNHTSCYLHANARPRYIVKKNPTNNTTQVLIAFVAIRNIEKGEPILHYYSSPIEYPGPRFNSPIEYPCPRCNSNNHDEVIGKKIELAPIFGDKLLFERAYYKDRTTRIRKLDFSDKFYKSVFPYMYMKAVSFLYPKIGSNGSNLFEFELNLPARYLVKYGCRLLQSDAPLLTPPHEQVKDLHGRLEINIEEAIQQILADAESLKIRVFLVVDYKNFFGEVSTTAVIAPEKSNLWPIGAIMVLRPSKLSSTTGRFTIMGLPRRDLEHTNFCGDEVTRCGWPINVIERKRIPKTASDIWDNKLMRYQ